MLLEFENKLTRERRSILRNEERNALRPSKKKRQKLIEPIDANRDRHRYSYASRRIERRSHELVASVRDERDDSSAPRSPPSPQRETSRCPENEDEAALPEAASARGACQNSAQIGLPASPPLTVHERSIRPIMKPLFTLTKTII